MSQYEEGIAVISVRGKTLLLGHVKNKSTAKSVTLSLIRAPSPVTSVTVVSKKHSSFVFIATEDDSVWEVSVLDLEHHDDSRDKSDGYEESEQLTDSEDIFGDLLGQKSHKDGGEHGRQTHSFKHSSYSHLHTLHLRPEHLLLSMDNSVIDLAASSNLLCVLVDKSGLAKVDVFHCPEKQPGKGAVKDRMQLLQSYTTGLNATLFCGMSGKRSRCLCIIMQEPNTLSDLSNSSPPEVAASWPSSSVIFVPTLLFISMFGKESACLNSPIVILCTISGCVYTFVVKFLPNASTRGLGVICELGCEIAGFLPVQVGRTEGEEAAENETANAAITAVLNRGHNQHASEKLEAGLVILSITGEGCLYLPKSLESSYPLVLMFTLPHPVKCCIVYDNSMVCSTGWSLEKYELTLTRQVEDGILAVTFVSKTPLRQAGIQELLHLSVENQTDRTMIAGIASNLEAIHICTVPREDWSGIQRSTFQSIIDTLHSIEQLSLELKSIKEKAQSSDSFLLQMNFFANLVHYGKSQKESQEMSSKILIEAGLSESFLSCHCSILSSLNVYGWNWSLKVTLLNNSPVSLSGDWVIVISLHDMEWHSVQSGKQSLCFNCSLPLLTGLKSRSSFSISIPLDQVARNHLIPVFELSVSLVLNLKDYDTLSTDLSTNILQKGLKVEVYRQKFDILHFSQKQNSQELDGNSGSEDTAIKNSSDMEWLHYELSKIAHMRDTASHFVGDSTQRVITT